MINLDVKKKPDIANIIKLVSGVDEVSENHSLKYYLDSLQLTSLVAKLRSVYRKDITMADIYGAKHIADLHNILKSASVISPVSYKELEPDLSNQNRFFISEKKHPSMAGIYFIVMSWHIQGVLDDYKLKKALENVLLEQLQMSDNSLYGIYGYLQPEITIDKISANKQDFFKYFKALLKHKQSHINEQKAIASLRIVTNGTETIIFICAHHSYLDGYSLSLFRKAVLDVYNEKKDGLKLTPLVNFQKVYTHYKETQQYKIDKEYWVSKTKALSLLYLGPEYASQSTSAERIPFTLATEEANWLEAIAVEMQVTKYTVISSIFSAFLSFLTSKEQIQFSSPFANRWKEESFLSVIGPVLNTLINVMPVPKKATLRELVKAFDDQFTKNVVHGGFGLEDISFLEESKTNFMLSYHNDFEVSTSFNDYEMKVSNPCSGKSKYLQEWIFVEYQGELKASVEYRTEVYNKSYIKQLISYFKRLLEFMTTQPDAPFEKAFSFADFSGKPSLKTSIPVPKKAYLLAPFEKFARKNPDHIAIVSEGKKITYRNFYNDVINMACVLKGMGVTQGSSVGLYLHRSYDLVKCVYAVLKIGAHYIPFSKELPLKSLHDLMDSAALQLLLTDEKDKITYNPIIDVTKSPEPKIKEQDLGTIDTYSDLIAYRIYTSGSTGNPKGVMISHKSIYNRIQWMKRYFKVASGDIILHKTPYTFDVSVWELFLPLFSGATMVLAPKDLHKNPLELADFMKVNKISMVHFVPTMLREFLADIDKRQFPALKQVICSGEALLPADLTKFYSKFRDSRLYNLYGPTEASVDVTIYPCSKKDSQLKRIPIGFTIDHTKIFITNSQNEVLPTYVTGEIVISGCGVGLGYFNESELTATKFISNEKSGSGIFYKTGDLGYYDENGILYFLGRTDDQIKLNGVRLELGAVADKIKTLTKCECIVLFGEYFQENILAAFIRTSTSLTENELKKSLREVLPYAQIPQQMLTVKSFPVTANGKLDKKMLWSQLLQKENTRVNTKWHPDNAKEKALYESLVQSGLSRSITNDDLFFQGLNSINILSVIRTLKKMGYTLKPENFFETPTPGELSQRIEEIIPDLHNSDDQLKAVTEVPTTLLQKTMLLHSIHSEKYYYHDIFCYRFKGLLPLENIKNNFYKASLAQPMLRAKIDRENPERFLISELPGEVQELVHLNFSETKSFIKKLEASKATATLKIIYITYRDAKNESVLLISFNHAIMDGYSVSMLVAMLFHGSSIEDRPFGNQESLITNYLNESNTLKDRNLRKKVHRYLQGIKYRRKNEFKSRFCLAVEETKINTGRKRFKSYFSPDFEQNLEKLCKRFKTTQKELLLGLFYLQHLKSSGNDENTIGVVTHTRPADGERCIGLFLNTLPFYLNDPELKIAIFFEKVQSLLKELFLYRNFPLQEMIKMQQSNLFNLVFNFIDFEYYESLMHSSDVNPKDILIHEKTDLPAIFTIGKNPLKEGVFVSVDYDSELFDPLLIGKNWIRRFLQGIENTANKLLRLPEDDKIASLYEAPHFPLTTGFTDDYLLQILKNLNSGGDNPAIITASQTISYKELGERVFNYIAHLQQLLRNQINKRIVVFPERNPETIALYLAINLSGNTIVPLNKELPSKRIQDCINIVNPELIIEPKKFALEVSANPQHEISYRKPKAPYILFTSGSTKLPKGVEMSFRCFNNLIWHCKETSQKQHGETALNTAQISSLTFDVSFQEIFLTLTEEASLCIMEEGLSTIESIVDNIKKMQINRLFIPYVLLKTLADLSEHKYADLKSVKEIVVAGEALKITPSIRKLFEETGAKLVNQYGPTETHVITEYALPATTPDLWPDLPAIGKPISHVKLLILDTKNVPVSAGVPGELFVEESSTALGYLNPENKGFETILVNGLPFKGYRTGDLVARDANGLIHFLGRVDREFKRRGFRVNPLEIEMMAQDFIDDDKAFVHLKQSNEKNRPELLLFLYSKGKVNTTIIEQRLKEQLPHYMCPDRVINLEELPLLPSGKVDVRRLKAAPLQKQPNEKTQHEEKLSKIWKEILKLSLINPDDNFFDLGGNSLSVLYLITKIHKTYGRRISLQQVYKHPTLKQMTLILEDTTKKQDENLIPIKKSKGEPEKTVLFIHPIGGSAHCYHHVAKYLPDRYNCYAIEGFESLRDTSGRKMETIQQLAMHYLNLAKDVLSENTLLCGWSFGGIVAYEMVSLLEKYNTRISGLIIIDSYLVETGKEIVISKEQKVHWFIWELIAGEKGENYNIDLLVKNKDTDQILKEGFSLALKSGVLPHEISEKEYCLLYEIFERNLNAICTYAPADTIKAEVALLRSKEELPSNLKLVHDLVGSFHTDVYNGWGNYVSGAILVRNLNGDHLTIMHENNAKTIASEIEAVEAIFDKNIKSVKNYYEL
jgi:amino acid adenylation domain-containing protein